MPSFFLSFNVLRKQAQLKGWSNRPEVPLTSRWRKKDARPSSATAARPYSNSKPTASAPTTTIASASIYVTKPSLSPGRSTTTSNSVSKGGATTNVLLIHPICRCCTDVVNSIMRPYKRRASNSKASMHTTPTTAAAAARSCSGRNSKTTWDGLPSTHYMRLWPEPDHEKLREAKLMISSPRSRFAASSCSPRPGSPPGEKKTSGKNSKKQKRRSIWKFWPSIF